MMGTALAVFFGAGMGALLRWQLQLYLGGVGSYWPWGTLAANVLGGFLAGILVANASRLSPAAQPLLMTGVLGGLTTFSSFTVELVSMHQRGDGLLGAAYAAVSLVLAFGCCLGAQLFFKGA